MRAIDAPEQQGPGEPTERSRLLVERKLRELVEQGFFDNLPGAGRPLDLADEDNPFIPDDRRLTNRILRNAGIAPAWIELGNEIESDRVALRRRAARHGEWIRTELDRLRRAMPGTRNGRVNRLRAAHERFVAEHLAAAEELNRKVDRFNLIAPGVFLQKLRVDLRREVAEHSRLLRAGLGEP